MPTLHTAGLTGGRGRRRGDAIQETTRGWPSWKRAFEVGHHSSNPNGGRPPFEIWSCFISSTPPPMQTSNSTSCCRRMEICCGKMGGRSAMEPWELTSKKCPKKKRERETSNAASFPFLATSSGTSNGLESPRHLPAISPPHRIKSFSARFHHPISRPRKRKRLFFKLQIRQLARHLPPFLATPKTKTLHFAAPRVTAQASAKPPAR